MSTTVARASLGALLLPVAAFGLSACGSAGKTTCAEYAAMTLGDRYRVETALLEAHRLEPNDIGNRLGLTSSIVSFCGIGAADQIQGEGTATRNSGSAIEAAVDWDSDRW